MSPSVPVVKTAHVNTTKLLESITSWQKSWNGIIALIEAGNWNGITHLRKTGKASERERPQL